MSDIKEKSTIKEQWDKLSSETKQKAIMLAAVAGLLLIIMSSYYGSGESQRRAEQNIVLEKKKLNLGKDLLEDDIQEKVNSSIKEQNTLINEQSKRMSSLEEMLPDIHKELARMSSEIDQGNGDGINASLVGAAEHLTLTSTSTSVPTSATATSYPQYKPPQGYQLSHHEPLQGLPEVKMEVVGGVGHSQGEPLKKKNNKKKQKSFYLAPGFMEAQILHGIEAYTSEGANANPEPLLIRVQAPAVLPNNIKAQLAGCFVMANVYGSLAKERIEAQVVNLSCLSPDGSAVIDQEVLGYIVDADGKKGLTANIVTKMGQHVARSFLAGFAGGIGEGVSLGGTQTNITGSGQIQSFDASKIGQTAMGQGIRNATDDIKKLFIELTKQTMPVAEIGAAKKCTVVIQKGVELIIRDRNLFVSNN